MNTLFTHYVACPLSQQINSGIPQQVLQLTHQIELMMQQILSDCGHYGLLMAGILVGILVFTCGMMVLVEYLPVKPAQSFPFPVSDKPTYRRSKRIIDTRIARANRAALRLASARIRAGQLSN